MATGNRIDPNIRKDLTEVYEQLIWLARRPGVTPSMARAWYTHIWAGRFAKRIRTFTGKVSRAAAADPEAELRLEHYLRMQTLLTQLVERHLSLRKPDADEFVRLVIKCERVHIVTFRENYEARKADGDYKKAGIPLVAWNSLPASVRQRLWKRMLRGRVANAEKYAAKAG